MGRLCQFCWYTNWNWTWVLIFEMVSLNPIIEVFSQSFEKPVFLKSASCNRLASFSLSTNWQLNLPVISPSPCISTCNALLAYWENLSLEMWRTLWEKASMLREFSSIKPHRKRTKGMLTGTRICPPLWLAVTRSSSTRRRSGRASIENPLASGAISTGSAPGWVSTQAPSCK